MNKIGKKKSFFEVSTILFMVIFSFSTAIADTEQYRFDVHIRGIKAGVLRYALNSQGEKYSIHGILESTGLVGILVRYKFDAQALGNRFGNTYQPEYYSEVSDTGRRKSEKVIRYRSGVPEVTSKKLKKPHWLDPSTQKGTLDPMTAMAALLSDQLKKNLCELNLPMFDGTRRVDITLSGLKMTEKGPRCTGVYQRIGGFTEKEWSDGESFPFILDYEFEGGLYRVKRFDITTLRGRASFVRK
ncbi:MAG: DUF3108 domain-containing protein [Paracoccaceae bacterium]|nr:DUF3108 domain-containing protein [Paracoccaceae bacterium]